MTGNSDGMLDMDMSVLKSRWILNCFKKQVSGVTKLHHLEKYLSSAKNQNI